jgi:hypothetical protein
MAGTVGVMPIPIRAVSFQRRHRLGDLHSLAMEEHRGTADDLDVTETELTQVRLGGLAPNADRRRPVEDGPRECLDRVVERADRAGLVRTGELDPDTEDGHRDRQPLDDLVRRMRLSMYDRRKAFASGMT